MNAALKVVKYLKGYPGLRTLLSQDCNIKMTTYCEMDYASYLMIGRSITDFYIKLGIVNFMEDKEIVNSFIIVS